MAYYSSDIRASAMDQKRAKTQRSKYPYPFTSVLCVHDNPKPLRNVQSLEQLSKREYYKLSQSTYTGLKWRGRYRDQRSEWKPLKQIHVRPAELDDQDVSTDMARTKPEEMSGSWYVDAETGIDNDEYNPVAGQLALHDAVNAALDKFEEAQFNKMVKSEYEVVREPDMDDYVLV